MEHVAAMLLILGCTDGAMDCASTQTKLSQFETVQACESVMVEDMMTFVSEHEVVLAQCVPVDPALNQGWELSWTVSDNGKINALANPLPMQQSPIRVASR